MEIPATPENRVLASAVNSRIRSDARLLNARAALFRLAGIGLLLLLAGGGLGAAFFGYSYIADPGPIADKVARTVAQALSTVTLRTEGRVSLDPDAKVRLEGGGAPAPEIPRPSAAQLAGASTQPPRAEVVTNFTVFKTVPFGRGQVVTGWNFPSSEERVPAHQYCYYSEQLDGSSKLTVDLGENGRPAVQAKARPNLDPAVAYGNCIWFKGAT